MESPTGRPYTLGNFFDIWRQPLGPTRVGPATGPVTAYVDGRAYHGDPRGIVLREHADIQLDVGFPLVPPQPVDWSRSQLNGRSLSVVDCQSVWACSCPRHRCHFQALRRCPTYRCS